MYYRLVILYKRDIFVHVELYFFIDIVALYSKFVIRKLAFFLLVIFLTSCVNGRISKLQVALLIAVFNYSDMRVAHSAAQESSCTL